MEVSMIVTAMREPVRFGKLTIEKRVAALTAIIARLYSLKGMGGDAQKMQAEISLAVQELEREIALKYPFFTPGEAKIALESGVKGELDDQPAYLNVANYCRWLRIYRESAARLEASQAVANNIRVAPPAAQIDSGTVESRNRVAGEAYLKTLIAEVKQYGYILPEHLDGACASLYNSLREEGKMEKPSAAAIQEAMHKAAKRMPAGREGRSIEEIIQSAAGCVRAGAKRFLLEEYLKTL